MRRVSSDDGECFGEPRKPCARVRWNFSKVQIGLDTYRSSRERNGNSFETVRRRRGRRAAVRRVLRGALRVLRRGRFGRLLVERGRRRGGRLGRRRGDYAHGGGDSREETEETAQVSGGVRGLARRVVALPRPRTLRRPAPRRRPKIEQFYVWFLESG